MDRFLFFEDAFPFPSALAPRPMRVCLWGRRSAPWPWVFTLGCAETSPRGKDTHIFWESISRCVLFARVGQLESAPGPGLGSLVSPVTVVPPPAAQPAAPLLSLTWRVPPLGPREGACLTAWCGDWELVTRPRGSESSRALFPTKLQDSLIELSAGTSLKQIFGGRSLCDFGGHVIQKESKELGDTAVTKLPCPRLLVHVTRFLCACVCKHQQTGVAWMLSALSFRW